VSFASSAATFFSSSCSRADFLPFAAPPSTASGAFANRFRCYT
jgi:hypothetical protein